MSQQERTTYTVTSLTANRGLFESVHYDRESAVSEYEDLADSLSLHCDMRSVIAPDVIDVGKTMKDSDIIGVWLSMRVPCADHDAYLRSKTVEFPLQAIVTLPEPVNEK